MEQRFGIQASVSPGQAPWREGHRTRVGNEGCSSIELGIHRSHRSFLAASWCWIETVLASVDPANVHIWSLVQPHWAHLPPSCLFCLGQLHLIFSGGSTGCACPWIPPDLFHLWNLKAKSLVLFLRFCYDDSPLRNRTWFPSAQQQEWSNPPKTQLIYQSTFLPHYQNKELEECHPHFMFGWRRETIKESYMLSQETFTLKGNLSSCGSPWQGIW